MICIVSAQDRLVNDKNMTDVRQGSRCAKNIRRAIRINSFREQ
jgi:hypothetical protein